MMQGNQKEEMEGVESIDPPTNSLPLMTADEKRVLELYDRLEELRLEIALLKAQGVLSQGTSIQTYVYWYIFSPFKMNRQKYRRTM
jgi:hypothetical protein